jgi:hypothetical protein
MRLFLHCILKANHKDKKHKGTLVLRGSFLTGFDVLSKQTGLSVRQVRTAMTKLESTSEVTRIATSKGQAVTVVNYNKYQNDESQATSGTTSTVTNERQASDKPTTSNKNGNNIIIKEEESKEAPARQEFPTLEKVLSFAKSQPLIIQPDCAETYFNDMEACEWVDKFNRPIKNWQASLRAYASRWNQFSQRKSTPSHHTSTPVKYGI